MHVFNMLMRIQQLFTHGKCKDQKSVTIRPITRLNIIIIIIIIIRYIRQDAC